MQRVTTAEMQQYVAFCPSCSQPVTFATPDYVDPTLESVDARCGGCGRRWAFVFQCDASGTFGVMAFQCDNGDRVMAPQTEPRVVTQEAIDDLLLDPTRVGPKPVPPVPEEV